ncbi:MAG: metal-sensitive transcriptional regulator [Eubacteriales bacterium]
MNNNADSREAIITRLKKIEGQVKGLQRMMENDKCCPDILIQVSAVKAAVNKVGIKIFEQHSRTCLKNALLENNEKSIDELIDVINKFVK